MKIASHPPGSRAVTPAEAGATAGSAPDAVFDALLAGLVDAGSMTGDATALSSGPVSAAAWPDETQTLAPDKRSDALALANAAEATPPESAVQALLDSVQAAQSLGVAVSAAGSDDTESPAALTSTGGDTPGSAATARATPAVAARAAATRHADALAATARADTRLAADGDAAATTAATAATTAATPHTADSRQAAVAALQRQADRDGGAPSTPAIFAAAQTSTLATTELAPRQTALPVAPALVSPAWQQAFSDQVLWAARAELQSASLTLNPPELGPVSIELALTDHSASASFSSQQPEVRKAIEDALPLLKQMFADAGLQLQQADVGSGREQSASGNDAHSRRGRQSSAEGEHATTPLTVTGAPRRSNALLDTYA